MASLGAVLLVALASPFDPPIVAEPDDAAGLACYWTCMAFCIVAGKGQEQCDAVCTTMCFTVRVPPPGPTCTPDDGPICPG